MELIKVSSDKRVKMASPRSTNSSSHPILWCVESSWHSLGLDSEARTEKQNPNERIGQPATDDYQINRKPWYQSNCAFCASRVLRYFTCRWKQRSELIYHWIICLPNQASCLIWAFSNHGRELIFVFGLDQINDSE